MDFAEKHHTKLLPTKESGEPVRRQLAWLATETESSEEEAVALLVDAARELRLGMQDYDDVARTLAGVLQGAAATLQLLRELHPGGLPLSDLQDALRIMKAMRDGHLEIDKLEDLVGSMRRIISLGISIEQGEALLSELARRTGKDANEAKAMLQRAVERIVDSENLEEWITDAQEGQGELQRQLSDLASEARISEQRVATLRKEVQEKRQIVADLERKRCSIAATLRSLNKQVDGIMAWMGYPPRPPHRVRGATR